MPLVGESPVAPNISRLTEDDLPVIAEPGDDDAYDEVAESLRDRVDRCADHIRRLFAQAATLWEETTAAAEAGRIAHVRLYVHALQQLPAALSSAYSLWERCLVDLYIDSPGNLDYTGEMVALTEKWLADRR